MDQNLTNSLSPASKVLSTEQLCSESPNRSWFREVVAYESEDMEKQSVVTSSSDPSIDTIVSNEISAAIKTKTAKMNGANNTDEYILPVEDTESSESLCEREIVVKFLDSSNEEKYERLLKEEKIKTPLKRRMSSNSTSRSTSPLEENNAEQHSSDDSKNRVLFTKKTRINSEGGYIGHDLKKKHREIETDEGILARRQKQIDYGKNTVGYDRYVKAVPREKRTPEDPWTPPKNIKYSRRAFDGLIKVWRKKLHCYDPEGANRQRNDLEEASE